MVDEDIQHSQTIGLIAALGNRLTKDHLFFTIVHCGIELKLRNAVRFADRPAGEGSRYSDDILLRVTAIDSERVKLEQFPTVILVKPWCTTNLSCIRHAGVVARCLRLPIIEIEEHCR